jgi:hypothetical protein
MATVDWTDQRLNDAFEALRRDIADLKIEIRQTRSELHAEMHAGYRALWMALLGSYITIVVAIVGTALASAL